MLHMLNIVHRHFIIDVLYLQSGTATGTCGTVSWQVEHLDTRLIVMWSVPFNFNLYDSYFAIGMIFNRGRFTSSNYWFNQMYYSEKGPYKRGRGGQTITFENSAIVVVAHLEGSTYHPMLNISVIPQVRYKLAPLIWKRLYNMERSRYTGAAAPIRLGGGGGVGTLWSRSGSLSALAVALLITLLSSLITNCHLPVQLCHVRTDLQQVRSPALKRKSIASREHQRPSKPKKVQHPPDWQIPQLSSAEAITTANNYNSNPLPGTQPFDDGPCQPRKNLDPALSLPTPTRTVIKPTRVFQNCNKGDTGGEATRPCRELARRGLSTTSCHPVMLPKSHLTAKNCPSACNASENCSAPPKSSALVTHYWHRQSRQQRGTELLS